MLSVGYRHHSLLYSMERRAGKTAQKDRSRFLHQWAHCVEERWQRRWWRRRRDTRCLITHLRSFLRVKAEALRFVPLPAEGQINKLQNEDREGEIERVSEFHNPHMNVISSILYVRDAWESGRQKTNIPSKITNREQQLLTFSIRFRVAHRLGFSLARSQIDIFARVDPL